MASLIIVIHVCACVHIVDGSLYIFTPVDPLFLALPYLVEAAKVSGEVFRIIT